MFPVERARTLLQHLIPVNRSVPARKVHEAARRAGIPEWAIRKAKKRLGVEARFVGFGADGWWEWRWAEPWRWRPLAPEPTPPPPVCAWPVCGSPPRSPRAAYWRGAQADVPAPEQTRVGAKGPCAAEPGAEEIRYGT